MVNLKKQRTVLGFAVLALALSLSGRGQQNSTESAKSEIAVRLSVPKRAITAGEPFDVRVEIWNVGKTALFLRSKINPLMSDGISSLNLSLLDSRGRSSPAVTLAEGMRPPPIPEQNAFQALLGEWVLLPPGYSLGTTLSLNDSYFEFLRMPGRYQLTGTYSSVGLDSPAAFQRLGLDRAQIEALPFPSWSGKVRTNIVSIQVAEPAKKSR